MRVVGHIAALHTATVAETLLVASNETSKITSNIHDSISTSIHRSHIHTVRTVSHNRGHDLVHIVVHDQRHQPDLSSFGEMASLHMSGHLHHSSHLGSLPEGQDTFRERAIRNHCN